ncbi:MAG TPA: hypothetical protein VFG10_09750 [Saprospiraceae bacterium]|nr:hypothetical protein [Saprospiraceae bacterium]
MSIGIQNFLPSTDNLYKFLFVGGLAVLLFAFVYPLEKLQELQLASNDSGKNQEIYVEESKAFQASSLQFQGEVNRICKLIDSLSTIKSSTQRISNLKEFLLEYKDTYDKLNEEGKALILKNIDGKYEALKINILLHQIDTFNVIFFILVILGSISTSYGFRQWYRSTKEAENWQRKRNEAEFKAKELP